MSDNESRLELGSTKPYLDFSARVFEYRKNMMQLINDLNNDGKIVMGYGASTKGNVLLQFCN